MHENAFQDENHRKDVLKLNRILAWKQFYTDHIIIYALHGQILQAFCYIICPGYRISVLFNQCSTPVKHHYVQGCKAYVLFSNTSKSFMLVVY